MLLPRPVRKLLAVFRGTVSPVMIFLSITMGFWFGLIPGWSGFHTVIVVLVLVLNVHLGLFLLSAGLAKGLCFAAAPVLYHIGQGVHAYVPGLLSFLSAIPIVGMTDFSRYSVAGAFVAGPVLGVVAGLLVARSVIGFRRMLLKFEEGSEKFRKWYSKGWVRVMDRLLIGKRTKNAKALFSAKTKIIRKAGVAVAVLVLAISGGVLYVTKGGVVRDYLASTMTKANGAEVNLESLDLSALTGSVSATGIQVTDAQKPQNNQVAIGKVAADASLYDLFLGRLIMENVEVSDVRFDQQRSTPGKVVEAPVKEPAPFDPCEYQIDVNDIEKLETYFKNAKALKEKLEKVRKWLPKGKDQNEPEPEQIPQKYLDYLLARSSVPASPRLLAKKVKLDKVQVPSDFFGNSEIQLANISDAAKAAKLPVILEMKSYDTGAAVDVTVDYTSDQPTPEISGTFGGFDLSKMQSSLSQESGLMFEKGTASGKFNGTVTDQFVDLAMEVSLQDLQARAQGKGILGLDAKTASEALEVLKNISTTIRIVGPVAEPRLVFDVKGLQDEFKNALVEAGKQKVAEEIDKQIDKQLGDKVPDEVKDILKDKKLLDGLGGLLGGKKDDK
jgi:uncharacterized protein (TIGR03546 family)